MDPELNYIDFRSWAKMVEGIQFVSWGATAEA